MSNTEKNDVFIDPELVNKIKKDIIEKSYYSDVKFNIRWKSYWKIIADVSETFAHIFTGVSAILAFASGFFNYTLLSFIAGCFGTGALVLLKFSSYAIAQSKERTQQVNLILDKLGIVDIPDITSVVTTSTNGARLTNPTEDTSFKPAVSERKKKKTENNILPRNESAFIKINIADDTKQNNHMEQINDKKTEEV
jgi:hypothetical protein